MVSVCWPSDALSQHLPSYLGFSYLGRGVSLHGCSSKAQLLLLTLDTVPEELWTEVRDIVQETGIKTIPREKKCKKAKWLSGEALQITVKRRKQKAKEKRKDISI